MFNFTLLNALRSQKVVNTLAVVLTLMVIYLSLGNGPQLDISWLDFVGFDKVKHFTAYFTLAIIWSQFWSFRTLKDSNTIGIYVWVGLFLLGALLEVLQWWFFPARFFEFADMFANGLGAGVGIIIFKRIFSTTKR